MHNRYIVSYITIWIFNALSMNVTALALKVLEATCSKAVGRAPFYRQ